MEELSPRDLRLCLDGDPRACRRLVERHQRLVFAVASRVLGRGAQDLADISQEAFLKVFSALSGFDPQGPAKLSTWVATIAARTAVDAARRKKILVSLDAVRNVSDPAHALPDESIDQSRRRERLARAMEKLTPEQRAAMVLRVEHELSYEAVAEALGVEVGTVKSRLARARETLSEAVEPRGEVAGS